MIKVTQISENNLKKFLKFTGLYQFHENSLWYVASINNFQCGTLLASKDRNVCTINNLFVQKPLRREGIATTLFNALLKKCKEEGCTEIYINAVTDKKSIEELNLFLKNYDFEPVNIVAKIYTFNDLNSILNNKLVKYSITTQLTPPPGIKILALNEVDQHLIDNVVKKVNINYPDYYSLLPVDLDLPLQHANTFVAVANNTEIIGWLLGLDVPDGSIFYKTFYVKEEYRNLAIGFYLMCYCVKNHAAKYLYRPALCGISLKNPSADQFNSVFFKDVNKLVSYEIETSKTFLTKNS